MRRLRKVIGPGKPSKVERPSVQYTGKRGIGLNPFLFDDILEPVDDFFFGGGMKVFNRTNSRNTGALETLTSYMLISPQNSSAANLSVQISEVPVGSEQPMHRHMPEQCYYIVRGKGLMTIEDEKRQVSPGDAVYIPSNSVHGIRNIGDGALEYLTVNSPAFSREYEDRLWSSDPSARVKKQ
jgi:mannose-6-phosphate isomerase-like protein (cupin superfamily)